MNGRSSEENSGMLMTARGWLEPFEDFLFSENGLLTYFSCDAPSAYYSGEQRHYERSKYE